MRGVSILWLFNLLLQSTMQHDPPTIRQTHNGPVEGVEQTSFFGTNYYSFRGIPYAEVPITGLDPYTGKKVDRRFKAPVSLKRSWTKPLQAKSYGKGCIPSMQYLSPTENTSEDCLYLNVFVPVGGAKKKTVLVWVYGGGFFEGSGDDFLYGPDFLVDADNIVVTFNYRLGIYGFMNLGCGEYTGNMGLKDQQLAIKWVYENIEHFSGNRNEILLFGESAGGASVNYQMLNEESRKYFTRALEFSGTSLNYWAFNRTNHLERMQEISNIRNKQKLIEWLKAIDSAELIKLQQRFSDIGTNLQHVPWDPTIESTETKGAFITKLPEEIYKSDNAPVMDAMFCFTSQEFVTFNSNITKSTEPPFLRGDWKDSDLELPFAGFDKDTYPEEYEHAFNLLKDAYFSDPTNVDEVIRGNIGIRSDLNFGYFILKAARYQVIANNRRKKKNTFVMRFGINTALNVFKSYYQLDYGAGHAEDVCYFFRCGMLDIQNVYKNLLQVRDDSNVVYRSIKRMVNIITNFARTGKPSVKGDTPFKSSILPDKIFCQDIANEPKTSMVTDILDQIHFDTWKEIEYTYHKLKSRDSDASTISSSSSSSSSSDDRKK